MNVYNSKKDKYLYINHHWERELSQQIQLMFKSRGCQQSIA